MCRSERRANKDVVAERSLYSTISNKQYGYCPHIEAIYVQTNIEAVLNNYWWREKKQ